MVVNIGKLKINILIAVIICAAFVLDSSAYVAMLLACAAAHELGHYAAIRAFGGRIEQISVLASGLDIRADRRLLSYKHDAVIYLAGAAFNLAAAAAAYVYMSRAGESEELTVFLLTNTAYAVMNLLPIKTLDGGKALKRVLEAAVGLDKAYKVSECASLAALIALTAAAAYLLVSTRENFSLLLVSAGLIWQSTGKA